MASKVKRFGAARGQRMSASRPQGDNEIIGRIGVSSIAELGLKAGLAGVTF